jgi:parvulin-like peptidyl-prolyl isomerase
MNMRMLWVSCILTFTLAACGQAATPAPTAAPEAGNTAATSVPAAPAAPAATTGDPVARVDNVALSRKELDERIARLEKGFSAQPAAPGQALPSKIEIEKELVERFVQQNLTLIVARQNNVSVTEQEIDERIEFFRSNIEAGGGKLEEAVQNQLGLSGANATDFREFVLFFVAREKLANTLVTTDTVRKQIEEQVLAEAKKEVEKANVAHILVQTEDEAKQVIERLDKGEDFAALAKELSQDPGSKDNGGIYEGIVRGQFVPEFEKAMFDDLKPGETTKTPVQTQFGFHVIRLIERSTGPAMTDEQAQLMVEQQLAQQLAVERDQKLQELVAAEREKAKAEGRLVEPTYPEPTPEPLPTLPPQPTVQP